MDLAASGNSGVPFISPNYRVSELSTKARKEGSISSSICWLKSSSARHPLNSGFNLITVLNFDVTISPWKLYYSKNWYCEKGTKLTFTRIGTLALTTFTCRILKHLLHSFAVKQEGRKSVLTARITLSPKLTIPLLVKIDWSGIYLAHLDFWAEEPPLHDHPTSTVHESLHPSPFLVFPSSH